MTDLIKPVNIAGAAIITQISLIAIMFVGALILRFRSIYYGVQRFSNLGWIILLFSLITLFSMVYSDEFSTLWGPLFVTARPTLLKWSTAIMLMFIFNIICVAILVFLTGGGRESVFSPIYFIIPALAIFLREPLGRVITYLIAVSLAFTITLLPIGIIESLTLSMRFNRSDDSKVYADRIALWFVSISCFALATYIGYITRA